MFRFLSFFVPIFAWNTPLVSVIFLKRSLVFPILLFSSISLDSSLKKAFYLSLLFFGTLHSDEYIFPFLLCISILFFSQLFVRPPQTTILPFWISFSWGWSWECCIPSKNDTPHPKAKENPWQDSRRGKITFRIKSHTHQRYLEGSNKTLSASGVPTETEPDLPLSVWVSPMEVQQWPATGAGALDAADLGVV